MPDHLSDARFCATSASQAPNAGSAISWLTVTCKQIIAHLEAQQASQQAAQITQALRRGRWHVVALQGGEQGGCALGLCGVVSQGAQQQRQRSADGGLHLGAAGAQLLRHLLHGRALELGHEVIDHGLRWGGVVVHVYVLLPWFRMAQYASPEEHAVRRAGR